MILIDTTVCSLALRRRPEDLDQRQRILVDEWIRLVRGGEAALIGPVRQEILSGVRDQAQLARLRLYLSGLAYFEILISDYDQAADFFNLCQSRGITGGDVDMLICAVAARNGIPIFTTDNDFKLYAEHLPVRLHIR